MSVKDCDTHKLMYHPEYVSKFRNAEQIGPIHAEIGITNKCNHKCRFCTLDWITHGCDTLSYNVMKDCLDDLHALGTKSIYFAGEGEPTMHPQYADIIQYANQKNLKQSVSTNGSQYIPSIAEKTLPCLSWMRFSLDAATPTSHAYIHGVSENEFPKILKNIANCVELKRKHNYTVDIGVQLILMPENMNEVENFVLLMKNIGVDNVQIKPAHTHPKSSFQATNIYNFTQSTLIETIKKHETENYLIIFRTKSMERLTEERNYKECHGFHCYAIIDAKGNIVPCNVFYNNPEYIYGNINKERFKDIWLSPTRTAIIQKIAESNHSFCGEYRCRLDVINRYLERIKHPEENDEFI